MRNSAKVRSTYISSLSSRSCLIREWKWTRKIKIYIIKYYVLAIVTMLFAIQLPLTYKVDVNAGMKQGGRGRLRYAQFRVCPLAELLSTVVVQYMSPITSHTADKKCLIYIKTFVRKSYWWAMVTWMRWKNEIKLLYVIESFSRSRSRSSTAYVHITICSIPIVNHSSRYIVLWIGCWIINPNVMNDVIIKYSL
jgi:hypothetical protein